MSRVFNPKNNGPDQRLPVITRATADSDRYGLPRNITPPFQHRNLMLGSAPLADQKRSRGELAQRSYAYWPPGTRLLRHALEQPARGRLETAEHALLHPVGNRAHQQITAETGRRLGFVEDLPTRSQLVDVQ